jgi:integrase/recombinase XerC
MQTGLRIGEISRLKLEHLQLKSNPPQALISAFASTPMRVIELNSAAQEVIKEFIPHRLVVEKDKGFLFNTKNGGNMNIRNIRSAVNRVFQKAGIKNATVNDLRNTFIVHQLNKGVSLEKVSQVVGHRRYSSTEKYLPLLKRSKLGKGSKLVNL